MKNQQQFKAAAPIILSYFQSHTQTKCMSIFVLSFHAKPICSYPCSCLSFLYPIKFAYCSKCHYLQTNHEQHSRVCNCQGKNNMIRFYRKKPQICKTTTLHLHSAHRVAQSHHDYLKANNSRKITIIIN